MLLRLDTWPAWWPISRPIAGSITRQTEGQFRYGALCTDLSRSVFVYKRAVILTRRGGGWTWYRFCDMAALALKWTPPTPPPPLPDTTNTANNVKNHFIQEQRKYRAFSHTHFYYSHYQLFSVWIKRFQSRDQGRKTEVKFKSVSPPKHALWSSAGL